MIGKAKMSMKAALTFACVNMKKLAKLLDRLDNNGGDFSPINKEFTLLFEKLIYFRLNIEKKPTNPNYQWVCRRSDPPTREDLNIRLNFCYCCFCFLK